jgi:hypothetical protein
MQGGSRTDAESRMRALALLLLCVVVLAVGLPAHAEAGTVTHRVPAHAAFAVTSAGDAGSHAPRHLDHAVTPDAPVGGPLAAAPGTRSSSSIVSSRTAQAAPARGPPADAA